MNKEISLTHLFASRNDFVQVRESATRAIHGQNSERFQLLTFVEVIDQLYVLLDEDPISQQSINIVSGMMNTKPYLEIFDTVDQITQSDSLEVLKLKSPAVARGYEELKKAIDHLKQAFNPARPAGTGYPKFNL